VTPAAAWAAQPTIHGSNPIPVRALLTVAGTFLGLALLFSSRTPDATLPATGGSGSVAAVPRQTHPATAIGIADSTARPAHIDQSPAPASGAPTAAPSTATGPGSSPDHASQAPRPTAAPTVAATPAPTGRAASGDAVGPVENTPFGNVQVEVKATGGQIVDVVALELPNDRRRSAQISQYVEPILHDEVLQSQSAQIDLISGATWTSGAYQASLEGALAQLGMQ
jgi:uncharacterized protein with FMN-binding domain